MRGLQAFRLAAPQVRRFAAKPDCPPLIQLLRPRIDKRRATGPHGAVGRYFSYFTPRLNAKRKLDFGEPNDLPHRLAGVRGGRALSARTSDPMQELVLIKPGRAAEKEFAQEAAQAALRREFEERLAECGQLAYRVARGVLRNNADAEDVAQEALLRAYRRFERLR